MYASRRLGMALVGRASPPAGYPYAASTPPTGYPFPLARYSYPASTPPAGYPSPPAGYLYPASISPAGYPPSPAGYPYPASAPPARYAPLPAGYPHPASTPPATTTTKPLGKCRGKSSHAVRLPGDARGQASQCTGCVASNNGFIETPTNRTKNRDGRRQTHELYKKYEGGTSAL